MKLYTSLPKQIKSKGLIFKFYSALPTEKKLPLNVKFRAISVLAKNLRGKTDLHGKPYQPQSYLFIIKK